MNEKPILKVPETCWRIGEATRLRVLVDGEEYFRTVREAMLKAKKSIFILGWDINSRLTFVRPNPQDGMPVEFKRLLSALIKRSEDLHIHVLTWDYNWIYAREREFLPTEMKCWAFHPRMHFAMDGRHQIGASHHQKIVLIDDEIAFCGGFDLTSHRWDRRSHLPIDPLRRNADGKRYTPFHDVQMMVSGPVVNHVSELVRDRWLRATGDTIEINPQPDPESWLESVEPEMERVQVGISRTLSAYQKQTLVDEVERLYLETIRSAKKYIYIENQYFTSEAIALEIIASLKLEQGPEIVLIISENASGWLEEMTMDVLRSRWFEQLREVDQHHRFRIYHPLHGKAAITVHSKVMIADDRILRVGSANLSNRSMAVDSECDLSVDAALSPGAKDAIHARCLDLCSEHLDTPAGTLDEYWRESGSLILTIERFRGRNRTLIPVDEDLPLWMDGLVEGNANQAERPKRARRLMLYLQALQMYRWHVLIGLSVVGLLMTLWLSTPLQSLLGIGSVLRHLKDFGQAPNASVWMVILYVLFSFFAIPIWIPILITALAFAREQALVLSWLGALTSATLTYWAARLSGRKLLRAFASYEMKLLSRKLGAGGFWALAQMRFLPYYPFTIINLVAGASVMRFVKFLGATAIGIIPLIIAITLAKDGISFWLQGFSAPITIAVIGCATLLFAGYRLYRRRVRT